MNIPKIFVKRNTEWLSVNELFSMGVNKEIFEKEEVLSRKNGAGVEYLAASIKSQYLRNKNYIPDNTLVVDLIEIAKQIEDSDMGMNFIDVLNVAEVDKTILVDGYANGKLTKGVDLRRMHELWLPDARPKDKPKSIDDVILAQEKVRENIPSISIKSKKVSSLMAYGFILKNYMNSSPQQIAKELGMDKRTVELVLIKEGKLVMSQSEIDKALREMSHGQKMARKINHKLSIFDFAVLSGYSYPQVKNLIEYGLLETVVSHQNVSENSNIEISKRSAIYHFRKMDDPKYKKFAQKVMIKPQYVPPTRVSDNACDSSYKGFDSHIYFVKSIKLMNDNEFRSLSEKVKNAYDSILKALSPTELMKTFMDFTYLLVEKDSTNLDDYFDPVIDKETFTRLYEEYQELIKVSGEGKQKLSNIVKKTNLKRETIEYLASAMQNITWSTRVLDEEARISEKFAESLVIDSPSKALSFSYYNKKTRAARKKIKSIYKKIKMNNSEIEDIYDTIQKNLCVLTSVKEELVLRNLGYAAFKAKYNNVRYTNAVEGLMRASELFDFRKGYKFSTYATWWIKQKMKKNYYDYGRTIRIPVHAHNTLSTIQKIERKLRKEFGKTPTKKEIFHSYNALYIEKPLSYKIFNKLLDISRSTVSLDKHIYNHSKSLESGATLIDTIFYQNYSTPEDTASKKSVYHEIIKQLQTISAREEMVLRNRFGVFPGENYGKDKTLEEVGQRINLTRERVRQIEEKALGRLRHHTRSKKLRPLLDY